MPATKPEDDEEEEGQVFDEDDVAEKIVVGGKGDYGEDHTGNEQYDDDAAAEYPVGYEFDNMPMQTRPPFHGFHPRGGAFPPPGRGGPSFGPPFRGGGHSLRLPRGRGRPPGARGRGRGRGTGHYGAPITKYFAPR